MKEMGHYRLASAKAGDDATLTRYIRIDRDEERKPRRHSPRIPGLALPFVEHGRTKFPTRVISPNDMTTLLVSGHNNVKIGRDVRKGKLRGYWIYTLSLEERATCPRSCQHWQSCYGNNMPFAKRIDQLCRTRGRKGILIRLHALGDFYSEMYVAFWERMLTEHRNLAIYGYTARRCGTPIGDAIHATWLAHKDRFMIRVSDGADLSMSTVSIAAPEDRPADAFICPEQTGQTRCCATCGACWSTPKNVAFLAH